MKAPHKKKSYRDDSGFTSSVRRVPLLRNYHTHTSLCHHAAGTVEDYVKKAVELGMVELGMSDHMPFPDDILSERMLYSQLPCYCRTIDEMKKKYADRIVIRKGLEAEYFPRYREYYESLLQNGKVEYLILGQHFFEREIGKPQDMFEGMESSEDAVEYARITVEAMRTGLFSFLAHPDLFMSGGFAPDANTDRACDMILNEAVKLNYVLELNANGLRHKKPTYPCRYFWEKAVKTDILVIIGADAHSPKALGDEPIWMCRNLAAELGLNVIDRLPFKGADENEF